MKKDTKKQIAEKFAQMEKLDQLVLDANAIRRERRAKIEAEIQELLKAQKDFPKVGEMVWVWYSVSNPAGEAAEGKIVAIEWRPELSGFKVCVCMDPTPTARYAWRTVDKIWRSEDECVLAHLEYVLEQTKSKEKELDKQIARMKKKLSNKTKPS